MTLGIAPRAPLPPEITTDAPGGTQNDLHDRDVQPMRTTAGKLVVPCGEEPVCVILE